MKRLITLILSFILLTQVFAQTTKPAPNTHHPTPIIQHPAPNTQHPTPSIQHPAPCLFNPSSTHIYANYLFKSGEYTLASKEYERLIFFDSLNISYKERLFSSYRNSGEFGKAYKRFNTLFIDYNTAPSAVAVDYTCILFKQSNLPEIDNFLNIYKGFNHQDKLLFTISYKLVSHDWNEASILAQEIAATDNQNLQNLLLLTNNTKNIKYKNPDLSAGLSIFIPGLGKAYSGYWKDGLFSLLFTSIAVWQTYRGFDKHGINSAYGWIYGGIAVGFYMGNVYGSYKAANKYNETINHQIYHQIEEIIDNIN